MSNYLVSDAELIATADAIRAKTGSSEELVWGESTGFSSDIENIPSGGGSEEEKNVVFYDYDGTVVQRYNAAEFAALEALPENPSHEGLTAQGWNWSLSDAKAYVATYKKLNIGQIYITDDGKTRIYIDIDDEVVLSLYLSLIVNGQVSIDWGDGSDPDIVTGNSWNSTDRIDTPHNYSSTGNYIISINVISGSFKLYANTGSARKFINGNDQNGSESGPYTRGVKKVEIGANYNTFSHSITSYTFADFRYIETVTIPNGITLIDSNAFYGNTSLKFIAFPSGITQINADFSNDYSLEVISIPKGVTKIGIFSFSNLKNITFPEELTNLPSFQNCSVLESVIIPNGVTSIPQSVFLYCYSLKYVYIPNSIISIGDKAFSNCVSLKKIELPDSITNIGNGAFTNCYSLKSINIPKYLTTIPQSFVNSCKNITKLIIPNGVTSIEDNAFQGCSSLESIIIPNSVTSIGNTVFYGCKSLRSINVPNGITILGNKVIYECSALKSFIVPESVTSIGVQAFYNLYSISILKFESSVPPNIPNSGTFSNLPKACLIYVPYGCLADYTSAPNYPSSSTYTYVEYSTMPILDL